MVFRNSPFIRFQSNLEIGVVRVCGTHAGVADDTAATQPRPKGGLSVRIAGDFNSDLIRLLHSNTQSLFYRLEPAKDEWFTMRIEPYSPARHIPWVRVWPAQEILDDCLGRSTLNSVEGHEVRALPSPEFLVNAVRDAEAILERYTIGRPTTEMHAARGLIDALLSEVQRMGWVKADTSPVFDSIVDLSELLEAMKRLTRTTIHNMRTVRAAVSIAEHSNSPKVQSALDALVSEVGNFDKAALDKIVRPEGSS